MPVVIRCFLLASEYDLGLEALSVPMKEHLLAETLSPLEYNRIALFAPQLLNPTCSLHHCGFLTYMNGDCHGYLPNRFGAGSPLQQDRTITLRDPGFPSCADWLGTIT